LPRLKRERVETSKRRYFRTAVIQQAEQFQEFINESRFDKLKELLPADFKMLILPEMMMIEGREKVVQFWKDEKNRGLRSLKFELEKINFEAEEVLKKEGAGYLRFDTAAIVFGVMTRFKEDKSRRAAGVRANFCLMSRHRDDCNWGMVSLTLG